MGRPIVDLFGKTFDRLEVIGSAVIRKGHAYWIVNCNCGNSPEFYVRSNSLTTGNTKSCGCISREVTALTKLKNAKELCNKKFGHLTVSQISSKKSKTKDGFWFYVTCDHGMSGAISQPFEVHGSNLKSGNTKSCGCVRAKKLSAITKSHPKSLEQQEKARNGTLRCMSA